LPGSGISSPFEHGVASTVAIAEARARLAALCVLTLEDARDLRRALARAAARQRRRRRCSRLEVRVGRAGLDPQTPRWRAVLDAPAVAAPADASSERLRIAAAAAMKALERRGTLGLSATALAHVSARGEIWTQSGLPPQAPANGLAARR
jgi:hypothetical protein